MKVMVVDDEMLVLSTLERFIKRLGHEPITAENGNKAIERYKEHKPDLVLLDMLLPDIKGDVVFKAIKEFDKDANIVFITGCIEEHLRGKELSGGKCLLKPIDVAKIKELIQNTQDKNKV